MSTNRVIWREGLFVKPQHFQQQQRHNDYQSAMSVEMLNCCAYGVYSLVLNHDLLKLGRIGLISAQGMMPDGTLFDIPHQDLLPQPLNIGLTHEASSRDIYLALPLRNESINEIGEANTVSASHRVRYREMLASVMDLHSEEGGISSLVLAQLAPRLMQGHEDMSAWTTLPVCRIREKLPDGTLVLDDDFIPTCLAVKASASLRRFMDEIQGTLGERAKRLAERIGSPGQQGIADVAEFMMLQLLNRLQPGFSHLATLKILHPQAFYHQLVQGCGELMTFTDITRLPGQFAVYNHDDLTTTFRPVIQMMRQALSTVLTPRAISIQLQEQAHGIRVATVGDRDLFSHADFVLAVKAQVPQTQLHRQFIQQTKITSLARIRELVSVQIQGVPLVVLPTAPRQLPYHAGYTYFMLDRKSPEWKNVQQGNAIAFHVSGQFPELAMQLWAIRDNG
ncbi:type VI secretion system baseplate subunit TssK [Erwinia tracheiphila]|uniref:Type VI secretion system baseplate subunit TssK n=1 Tax=Erwinia tracheiphila TaxID=65700 RepID=A0A345CNK1_9GAMM|nr:type VI secretion system baseplate subunit TssK [Erwinia tracheiphila]AXF75018.1 type VI secretion system baseplate subunit TssK [Erwinia tracheiphila]UIA82443.1 type VI secretion system baseplate subunit TssK [Erwinia tracheiphila]UIA91032.1 type VI secretion system baseplate subunit TssK [Erwinia tracheiphila]